MADDDFESASWMGGRRGVGVHSLPKVSYFFPKNVGEYHFGERHPMKPQRLTLTNHLVLGYGLHNHMDIYQPQQATEEELQAFHDEDYIDFLTRVTPQNVSQFANVLSKFNIGDDCPVFDGMYEYFKQYAGASIAAGKRLAAGQTDIAINWTGGLHHAKKFEASGFCYINDIVLAILELLRVHPRVLYIDIDIHHGDGVQEAFYNSNRVLTISFHKYAESFFPGTGHIDEIGNQLGKYFSLNIPLQDGIDNESYVSLFKAIMEPTIYTFQPSVIVLQCGADSLGCDRLGAFNLSIAAHGECVRFIKAFNIPLLVLGGGGYTVKNVARCWTYETAVLLDKQHTLSQFLPSTAYDSFFAPDYKLHPPISGRVENQNTRKDLERIRVGILERLRFMHGAPSVQMQEIPPDLSTWLAKEAELKEKEEKENDDASNDRDARVEKASLLTQGGLGASTSSVGGGATGRKGTSRKPSGQARSSKGGGNVATVGASTTGSAPSANTPVPKATANRRKRRNTVTLQDGGQTATNEPAEGTSMPAIDGQTLDDAMAAD